MSVSPLQFAREFARLKSDLSALPATDLKLLRLIRFWPDLKPLAGKVSYRTYFDEYIPFIHHLVTEQALLDFSIDELSALRDILRSLDKLSEIESARALNPAEASGLVTYTLATIHCDVGNFEKAIPLCAELSGDGDITFSDSEDLEGLDAFDTLRVLSERYKPEHPALANILKDIYERWEGERSCLNHDRAWCLFVEKNQIGQATRGRMRALHGTVELRTPQKKEGDSPDTVTFDNQVKSPDDPFIGVVYDSLTAVRNFLKKTRFSGKADGSYRAFFSIPKSQQTFTGDSIGLAAGLVAYTQLLKTEIMRQERFIASEVAFTGGLDADGRLLPIDKDTLGVKIERAFFSPVKYLVVAEECLADAREHLNSLSRKYPRRRLLLIGHERLTDVIENHNVVRSQKVCMGEFVVRKAARFSRKRFIQVPILIVLLIIGGFLYARQFPKHMPWFDDSPAYTFANVHDNSLRAHNRDSLLLWADTIQCNLLTGIGRTHDLDGDSKNEVVFLPCIDEYCKERDWIRFYSYDGELMFRRYGAILGEYPNDTPGVPYDAVYMNVVEVGGKPLVISMVTQELPARLHIRLWDGKGDSLGWYIHWGHGAFQRAIDLDSDGVEELLFLCINNRMECTALLALKTDSVVGFSPFRGCLDGNYNWMKRGSQYAYVLFPTSDIGKVPGELPAGYNMPGVIGIQVADAGLIKVYILESTTSDGQPSLLYFLDHELRVVKVSFNDALRNLRRQLVAERKLAPVDDWTAYMAGIRDAITYWTDSGWVTEGQLRGVDNSQNSQNPSK